MSAEFGGIISPKEIELLKLFGNVSFDIDGVWSATAPRSLEVFHEKYKSFLNGRIYTLDEITHPWKMDDWFKDVSQTEEERISLIRDHWNSEEVLSKAKPLSGATEVSALLDSISLVPYFITSRPFVTRGITDRWFFQHFPNINILQILLQSSQIYNEEHKVDSIDSYNIKVHFEDDPEQALKIVKRTKAIVVLVNQPWNRVYKEHPKIIKPELSSEGDLLHSFKALINYIRTGSYNSG